jgi:cyanophycinase
VSGPARRAPAPRAGHDGAVTHPGPVALVGSGEYLAVLHDVEAALLAGRPPRFVQLPTAAAQEGPASLGRWVDLGRAAAVRLGVEAVPLLVRDRTDADDPALAAQVDGAGLVYLSGGSPTWCAATLRGTAVWAAAVEAWRGGAALAGCSAGAMSLTDWVPDVRHPTRSAEVGLGVVPGLRVIPHFDRFAGWMPDLVGRYLARSPDGVEVVGVDEDTALVWDLPSAPGRWQVLGRQSVWVLRTGGRVEHPAGSLLDLPGPVDPG